MDKKENTIEIRMIGKDLDKIDPYFFHITCKDDTITLSFLKDGFCFDIDFADSIEADEFIEFLNKTKMKINISSSMIIEKKKYVGTKKILWKDDVIAISAGGVRLEFPGDDMQQLIVMLKYMLERKMG